MKIGVLAFSFLPRMGGVQVFSYNLLQCLAEQGHDVHLFLPHRYVRHLNESRIPYSFQCHSILADENRFVRYAPWVLGARLKQIQATFKFDVWQIIGAHHAGNIARYLKGVPRVLRAHGDDVQRDKSLNYGVRLDASVEKQISRAVTSMDCCVALTPTVFECYRELGVLKERIEVIPNMIDPSVFDVPSDSATLRASYGIRPNEKFLLTTGRYHLKKGYEYIPEVARHLLDEGVRFKWLVVGDGVSTLTPVFQAAGVDEFVLLREGCDAMSGSEGEQVVRMPPRALVELYLAADMFVMPSLLETFGMVLIEAMAAGLPMVTTDAPGCRDVVKDGENGLVVPCRESGALAKAILRLLDDPELSNTLCAQATSGLDQYRIEAVAGSYERLYRSLVEKVSL